MTMTKEAVWKNLKRSDVILLNVMPDDDFLKLHIQGSHSLPLFQNHNLFAAEVENKFGRNKLIITYSSDVTCAASLNAAQALKARGFIAQDYSGGLKEWQEAGYPVEGLQAKQLMPSR